MNEHKQVREYTASEARRKADQHWEMAGCAREDCDARDAARHTSLARAWARVAGNGGGPAPEGAMP